jgi:hypothetical protein
VDHSFLIGEQVTEEFVAGGRHGSCVWQVTRREVPYLWTITTSTPQVQAEITYRLSAQRETIIFERELTYVTSGLWFWVFDFLLMRRRMNRESRIVTGRAGVRRLEDFTDISAGRAPCDRGIIPQLPLVLCMRAQKRISAGQDEKHRE